MSVDPTPSLRKPDPQPADVVALPLTPLLAAEKIWLARFEQVVPATHAANMRILYRAACFDHPQHGPLVPGLNERYPPTARDGKSPRIELALIERAIRADLGKPEEAPIRKRDVQDWIALRMAQVSDGERLELFTAAERAVIAPRWAVEMMAAFVVQVPRTVRERVEAYARHYSNGKDGFNPVRARDDESAKYPSPASVKEIRDTAMGVFNRAIGKFKDELGSGIPSWLAPWPGYWKDLAVYPHPKAMARPQRRTTRGSVSEACRAADAACAKPFLARFNMTDIDIAKTPEVFYQSFETPDDARRWVQNAGIVRLARNRVLTLFGLTVIERKPQITEIRRGDVELHATDHPGVQPRYGVMRPVGTVLVSQTEKATDTLGAHHKPLVEELRDRMRVMFFLYEVIRGTGLTATDPVFLKKIFGRGSAQGLGERAIGTAAASILNEFGDEGTVTDGRAYNMLRRYANEAILNHFKAWKKTVRNVPNKVDAKTVAEITLTHSRVTLDPHTYAGLSDAEGRLAVSCHGAEIILQTIYGDLGAHRGPDRERIVAELATVQVLEEAKRRTVAELEMIRDDAASRSGANGLEDALRGAATVDAPDLVLKRQEKALSRQIKIQRTLIKQLRKDPRNWCELADDELSMTKRELRALEDDLLAAPRRAHAPVRDFCTFGELVLISGKDPRTIKGLVDAGSLVACQPNLRTILIDAASVPDSLVGASGMEALGRQLSVWPSGRGWDPATGAKTRDVRKLANNPAAAAGQPVNDLLSDPPKDCVRLFSFRTSKRPADRHARAHTEHKT